MINYSITYDDNMLNNYTDMLLKGIVTSNENLSIKDIPVLITMVDTSYPLAFIDYETDEVLGVYYTAEDGTERFVVINKKYVVDVAIMYDGDIEIITDKDADDTDVMFQ